MPTGYTAHIEDGKITSPKQFLHSCLLAFGVCYKINESVDILEEDYEPHLRAAFDKSIDYHLTRLNAARDQLAAFNQLTEDELYEMYRQETDKKYASYMKYYADALRKNETYDKFLDKIKEWKPSADFQEIKDFAIEQIDISKTKDPAYWANQADRVGTPSRERFEREKEEIIKDLRHQIDWEIEYNQKGYDDAVKNKESALDFYRRFKEEIKSLEV